MLGYNTSDVFPNSFSDAHFGNGIGQIVIDDLDCNGDEDDISLCQSTPWLTHNCGHGEDASVDCGARVRLDYNHVVQVLHGGQWFPLCYSSSNFGPREATVACRSLGETGYRTYYSTGYVHSYHWSTGYRCDGTEDDLSMCPTAGIYTHYGCQQIELICESTTTEEPYSTTLTPWWHEQGGLTGLRLVNGSHTGAGWVDLQYQGQWGTVCDGSFSNNDAQVICRMLGYVSNLGDARYHGGAFYGSGQGNLVLDDLRCSGYEQDIRSCSKKPYFSNNCSHGEYVGVDCGTGIRLTGGSSPLDGGVLYYSNSSWHGSCASGLSEETASVICRQLGFKFPRNTTHHTSLYRTHIDHYGFSCNGYERNLEECYKGPYHSCNQYYLAAVDCRTPLRLDFNHVLEVNYAGIWRPMCDNNNQFEYREATAACKSMGYDFYSNFYREGYSGGSFWRADFSCNTTDIDDFGWCLQSDWSYDSGCSPIRLNCATSTPSPYTTYPWRLTTGSITTEKPYSTTPTPWWHEQGGITGLKLVNGPHTGAGRVEIQYQGQWGTVCDDSFSNNDAQVICRMLGYVSNLGDARYHGSAFYGAGQGNIILDELRCSGYEQDIRSCNKNPYFNNDCSHGEDVGVDCSTGIRLVAGSSPLDGVVEHLSNNSWNSPCASGVSEESASVICRQFGFKFPRNTTHNGHQYNYPIDHYGFNCNGYERNVEECYKGPYHSCNQYNVAAVDCRTPMRLDYTHVLEVNYAGIWRPVCDNNNQFESREAIAACKSMGYDTYSNYNRVGYSGRSFWRADYSCNTTDIDDFGWCLESDWSYTYGCYPIRLNCENYQSTEEPERRTTAVSTYPWWLTATTSTPSYTTYPWWLTTASYRSTPYWYRQTTQGIPLESAFTVGCDSTGWIIHVDMSRLRLIYPDARASDIYLGDNACSGTENGWDLTFRQSLLDCLTNRIVSGSNIIYRNELVYAMHDPQHPYIIRSYNWTVDVECDVTRSESASGHLHHDSSNHTDHQVATGSHYSINMTFYKDAGFIHPIQGNPLHISVGTDVYVKVFTTAGDWSIKMKLHSCYTKPSPSAADHLKYYVIRNGCEVDSSTHIISQSTHETRFVFRDFEYTTNHEGIYIYCESVFCPTSDYSTQCLQTCNPNRKRSIQLDPKATSTVARKIVHVK